MHLQNAGHNIGAWPKAATGDFDGRLPPMMKLLLAADPVAAQALSKLGPDFEFQDIDPDDPQQLADCANLTTAIKSLLADVSQRGLVAMRERLTIALGRDVSEAEAATLTAGLSVDTVRGTVGWLPGALNANDPGPRPSAVAGLARIVPPYAPAGTWSRDDTTFSIRYRPAAHADPVLASWLELLAKTPDLDSRPVAKAMFKRAFKSDGTRFVCIVP